MATAGRIQHCAICEKCECRLTAVLKSADTPLVTFAAGSSASLDEALVEAEVVSDAVTPGRRTGVVAARQPVRQYLVDVS